MSDLERKKLFVDYRTIADGAYDPDDYDNTISIEQLLEWTKQELERAREDEYTGTGWWVDGKDVEWRIGVDSCELRLVGFRDEPEEEWKARVKQAEEKKRKQEEKERKQLQELMKKYPDIVKGEK